MKENLFIFELANNHQGSVNKAFKLISTAKLSKSNYGFCCKASVQRLNTFIHKEAKKLTINILIDF